MRVWFLTVAVTVCGAAAWTLANAIPWYRGPTTKWYPLPTATTSETSTRSLPNACHQDWRRIEQERRRLERQCEQFRHSSAALDHVAVRLTVGDLTLTEAVDIAEVFLRHRDGFDTTLAWQFPQLPRRLALARFLIQRAEAMWSSRDPSTWLSAAFRLEQQFVAFSKVVMRDSEN